MARALLIVDHGSRRPEAHAHLEWIAEQVRQREPELRVYVAHMEVTPPSIAEAIERCAAEGSTEVAVHPFFLVPGRHLEEDIPALLEQATRKHPGLRIEMLPSLGSLPEVADLVLRTLDRSKRS